MDRSSAGAASTTGAREDYRHIFGDRTPGERRELAHIKRFMERLVADPVFRDKLLQAHADDPGTVAREYGIDIDPEQMRSLWHNQDRKHRRTEEGNRWPLAVAWDAHIDRLLAHRERVREAGSTEASNPRFHGWRERQINRSASELGTSAGSIVHPIAAYELSEGCSLGCWFCGISADRFKGYLPYTPDNAELWRGVLGTMVDLFGVAAQTGFCYWATDPADNPDYPKFIEDHYHITGYLPQTTTAAPMKNLALTRKVIELQRKYPSIVNRFSIVTVKMLDRVHAEFSAEELLEVELVTQNKESLTAKANAGRARERSLKRAANGRGTGGLALNDNHSTIACVSGFLINMPNRTIKLVSPTRASDRWPLGYRVYDEARFDSPSTFRQAIESMIDQHMPESVPSDDRLAFRNDIRFATASQGFALEAGGIRYTCDRYPFSGRLGELIHEGTHKAGDVVGRLVSDGANVFLVGDALQSLYDLGVLNEDPSLGGIACKTVSCAAPPA